MTRACCTALLLTICSHAALAAQTVSDEPWLRKGTWMFSAEMGGAAFTDFQRGTARSMPDAELGDFHRRISAGTAMTLGGSVTRWITDGAGVRAGVSYSPTRFSVRNSDQATRTLEDMGEEQRETYARLDVWMANATAVFRVPVTLGKVVPYGLIGGGVVHLRRGQDAELPPEARRRFAGGTWTGPAAVFGFGATVPLQNRNLLMNFELTNHLTPTPLDDEGGGEAFELNGVPLELDRQSQRDSDGIGVTSNLRLTLGLTLPRAPR